MMQAPTNAEPAWATLTVWGVVNAVNCLQGAGFLARVRTGNMAINHVLGYVMIALSIPAAAALVAFIRAKASWLHWTGPAAYLAFLVLLLAVDYVWPVEFRSPRRLDILVPFLLLFFGAILLMGLPMYRLDHRLWLVTVATSIFLLVSMGVAMRKGVG